MSMFTKPNSGITAEQLAQLESAAQGTTQTAEINATVISETGTSVSSISSTTAAELAAAQAAIDAHTDADFTTISSAITATQAATATITAAVNTHVDTAQAALLSALIADTTSLATSAGLTGLQTTLASNINNAAASVTAAINAHTDAAQSSIVSALTADTSPLATQANLTTAVATSVTAAQSAIISALTADTSPLSTSAALSAAQTAINSNINNAAASVTAAINAHTDAAQSSIVSALTADTSPLATQANLTTAVATSVTAAQSAIISALTADTSPLSTSAALSAAQTAINSNTNAATALLSDPTVGLSAIQALITSATPSGIQANFRRDKVPTNYTPIVGMSTVPSGGFCTSHAATSANSGYGNALFVASGIGSGIWRYRLGFWQRFSIDNNQPLGSPVATPVATVATQGNTLAAAVIGQYIYYCALVNSAGAATTGLYRLDTTTGLHVALANMPRAIGAQGPCGSGAVVLANGNILFTCANATGLTPSAAAYPFWIYNPTTNATPIEVIATLNITKPPIGGFGAMPLQLLPSGKVITMDVQNPTSGNRMSCNLTIGTNTITSTPAENTGITNSTLCAGVIANGTGVFAPGLGVVYAEGQGWTASMTAPAYGSFYLCDAWVSAPGYGYLGYQNFANSGGSLNIYVYFVSGVGIGEAIISACKN